MVLPPQHGLSLCAGGGGLDMGLELAEPSFASAAYVEWEEYPRSTLIAAQEAGYLKPAPIWDNVKTFDARPWAGTVDTLLAGYPCQPFSQAGQRKGENDPRHLWPDIERIIGELGPHLRWCFFENVAGHLTLGLDTVLEALRRMGFATAVGIFSAEEVGASHERQRVFIVAYRAIERLSKPRLPKFEAQIAEGKPRPITGPERQSCELADAHGGNPSAERKQPGGEQRFQPQGANPSRSDKLAHTKRTRGHKGGHRANSGESGEGQANGPRAYCKGLFPPSPNDKSEWAHHIALSPHLAPSISLLDVKHRSDDFAPMVAKGKLAETPAKSDIRGMAHGMASRSRALRLLGNGVCPLAAAYAWRSLSAAHGLGWVDMGTSENDRKRAI